MAQIVVRNLEEDVKNRLQQLARRHKRSMEEEVRHILRDATKKRPATSAGLGSRIAARFRTAALTADVPELRGRKASPAEFEP